MAKKLTAKDYKQRAKLINKYLKRGIKHSKLDTKTKSEITRTYNKFKEYLNAPDQFKSIPIKESARKKQLAKNGYLTTKSRVIIPKYDANNVRLKGRTIQHLYADKYTETPIAPPEEILETFAEVFDNKKRNQFVAVSFGGAGLFKNTTFDSYASFYNYMSNFTPRDAKDSSDKQKRESKQQLIAQMRLVTVPGSWRGKLKTGDRKKAVPLSKALNRYK